MIQYNQFDDASSCQFSEWIGNRITYSELNRFEFEKYTAATYSIKYVLQGTEHYFTGNKRFAVSGGNFLLVNKLQPLDIVIHSRQKVLGFCIHIEDHIIQDVYTDLQLSEESLLNDPLHKLKVPEFEEIIYAESGNNLGTYLKQVVLDYKMNTGTLSIESTELFHHLARHLLLTQNTYLKGNDNLTAVKYSTKKELIRRLELAREIMEVSDTCSLNMETISQQAMMSGSHFFRSFKKMYGVSPYQFALQKKLQRSAQLLLKEQASITDVALSNGFADVATFSKAFKKQFGVSPVKFNR